MKVLEDVQTGANVPHFSSTSFFAYLLGGFGGALKSNPSPFELYSTKTTPNPLRYNQYIPPHIFLVHLLFSS
jgi:hypothetical protein